LNGKAHIEKIDDNTWNNTYDEKLSAYLGAVYARYPIGGYEAIIWRKE